MLTRNIIFMWSFPSQTCSTKISKWQQCLNIHFSLCQKSSQNKRVIEDKRRGRKWIKEGAGILMTVHLCYQPRPLLHCQQLHTPTILRGTWADNKTTANYKTAERFMSKTCFYFHVFMFSKTHNKGLRVYLYCQFSVIVYSPLVYKKC